jgi:hypothetical protein
MNRLIVAVTFLIAGCTGPRLVPYAPLDEKTDLDEKKLYEAAEGVLLDKGFLIETRDEAGHRLETEPRTMLGSQIAKDKFKYVFIVETGGGKLHIQLKCKDADSGEDCGKEVPEKMVKDQRSIADGILAEAGGK